jgi:hypothetical protein
MQKQDGSTLNRSMILITSGRLSHPLDQRGCWLGAPLSQHSARQALVASRAPVLVQSLGFEDDAGFG